MSGIITLTPRPMSSTFTCPVCVRKWTRATTGNCCKRCVARDMSSVTNLWVGLGKIWRTTTVRLTAMFIAIFIGFAILLLAVIAYQTSIQIQYQQYSAIEREVAQLRLLSTQSGLRTVAFGVQRLADRPGPGIYYLGDQTGIMIAGNVSDFP